MSNGKVLVMMGSDSDYKVMQACLQTLKDFNIAFDCHVSSAHRTPIEASEYAKNAEGSYNLIIAGAGMAAHLPGVVASFTSLPVIGVPISGSQLDGLDALLSMVQMPPGIPLATMPINGSKNAAIFAAEILSLKYGSLKELLKAYRQEMRKQVIEKDKAIQEKIKEDF